MAQEPEAGSGGQELNTDVTRPTRNRKPLTRQPVTHRPVTRQPVTYRPVTRQPVTYRPITRELVTRRRSDAGAAVAPGIARYRPVGRRP